MKIVSIVITMLIGFPVFAESAADIAPEYFPQQMSARKLLDACASSAMTGTGRERRRYCAGFVSGVEEAVRHLQAQHKLAASVCLPPGVSAKALSDAFVRYAANKQNDMGRPAAAVVLESLLEIYPCQPSGAQ